MPAPYLYEFDPSAEAPSNLVANEPHSIVINEAKVITLDHGCFYTEGLVVEINTPPYTDLVVNVDYFFRGFEPNLTALSGHEVASGLYFPTYVGNIRVSYQVVGGPNSFNSIIQKNIADAITELNNSPIDWNTIGNKPNVFPQDPHTHSALSDLNDLYRLSEKMEGIREALVGKRSVLHSNQELSDKINRLLYIIAEFKRRVDSAVTLSNSNVSGKEDIVNKITDLLNPGNIDNDKYPTTEAVVEYIADILTESGVIPLEPVPYERGIQYTTEDSLKRIIKDSEIYRLNSLGLSNIGLSFSLTTGVWEDNGSDYPWFAGGINSPVTYSNVMTTIVTANTIPLGSETGQGSTEIIDSVPTDEPAIWTYSTPPIQYHNTVSGEEKKVKILSHFDTSSPNINTEGDTWITNFWSITNYALNGINDVSPKNNFNKYLKSTINTSAQSQIATGTGTGTLQLLDDLTLTNNWTVDFQRYFIKPAAGKKHGILAIHESTAAGTRTAGDINVYVDDTNITIIILNSATTAGYTYAVPLTSFVGGGYNTGLVDTATGKMSNEFGWAHIEICARVVTPGSDIRMSIAINGKRIEDTNNCYSTIVLGSNPYPQKLMLGRAYLPGTGNVFSQTYDATKYIAYDEFRWTEGLRNTANFTAPTKPGIYENVTLASRTADVPFQPIYFKMNHIDSLPSTGKFIQIGFGDYDAGQGIFITFTRSGADLVITGSYVVAPGPTITAFTPLVISGAESDCWKRPSVIWLDSNDDNGIDDARICYGYIDPATKQVVVKYVSDSVTNLRTLINFERIAFYTNQTTLTFDFYNPTKLASLFDSLTPEMCYAEIPANTIMPGSTTNYDNGTSRKSIIYFTDSLKITEIEGDSQFFELDLVDSEDVIFKNDDHPSSNLISVRVEGAILELEALLQQFILTEYDTPIPYARGITYGDGDDKKAIIRNNRFVYIPNMDNIPFVTSGSWNGGSSGFPQWVSGTEGSTIIENGTKWNSNLFDETVIEGYSDGNISADLLTPQITVSATNNEVTWVLSHFNRIASGNRPYENGASRNEVGPTNNFWRMWRNTTEITTPPYEPNADTPNLLSQRQAEDWVLDTANPIYGNDCLAALDDGDNYDYFKVPVSVSNLVGDKGTKFPNLTIHTTPAVDENWFIDFNINLLNRANVWNSILHIEDYNTASVLTIYTNLNRIYLRVYTATGAMIINTSAQSPVFYNNFIYHVRVAYTYVGGISYIRLYTNGTLSFTLNWEGVLRPTTGPSPGFLPGNAYLFVMNNGLKTYGILLDEFRVNLGRTYTESYVSPPNGEVSIATTGYAVDKPFNVCRIGFKNTANLAIPETDKFIEFGYYNPTSDKRVYLKFSNPSPGNDVRLNAFTQVADGVPTPVGTEISFDNSSLFNELSQKDFYFFFKNTGSPNIPLVFDDIGTSGAPIYQSNAITSLVANWLDTTNNKIFIRTNMSTVVCDLWPGYKGSNFLFDSIPINDLADLNSPQYKYVPYQITLSADKDNFIPAGLEAGKIAFNSVDSDIISEDTNSAIREVNDKVNKLLGLRAIGVPKRQTVLTGPVNSTTGVADFLSFTSLTVNTVSATKLNPLVITFGDGFDERGPVDYIVKKIWDGIFATSYSWTVPAPAGTYYLYLELDEITGVVTPGVSVINAAPIYQLAQPSAASNTNIYWYPTDHRSRGALSDGTTWISKLRVYVGHAITNGASISSVVSYAYQGSCRGEIATLFDTTATTQQTFNQLFTDNIYAGRRNKDVKITLRIADSTTNWVINDVIDASLLMRNDVDAGGDFSITTENTVDGVRISKYAANDAVANLLVTKGGLAPENVTGYFNVVVNRNF